MVDGVTKMSGIRAVSAEARKAETYRKLFSYEVGDRSVTVSADQMNVTISVRVNSDLVPVIGMNLKRIDGTATGSIARN